MIGRYRIARDRYGGDENVIHLWREVPGDPIPRPSEGWDDLGIEPPDVQGCRVSFRLPGHCRLYACGCIQ